jgi:hypothetical protein
MSLIGEIEGFKKDFNNNPDDELLVIMNKHVQSSAAHIATAQILQKRRQDKIEEQISVGKYTNHLTLVVLILTIIILAVTIGQFLISGTKIPQNSIIRNRTVQNTEFDSNDNSE